MIQVEPKSLLEKLNKFCTRSLEGAAGLCVSRTHYEVSVEHLLLRLAEDPKADVAVILRHFDVDPARLVRSLQVAVESLRSGNAGKPVFSPILMEWIQEAWVISSIDLSIGEIRSGGLLIALVSQPGRYLGSESPELEKIRPEELRRNFGKIVDGSVEDVVTGSTATAARGRSAVTGGDGPLARFAVNYTARARGGEIDPVFGRDREIRQMIDILARRRKNNPILVGEAGVGKTAVVEGFALRIAEDDVPDLLRGVDVYGLDIGLLQAGAGVKGEFENRLKGVITQIKESPTPIITFIDEAHTLIGAGGPSGGSDAANLLKPALARGELKTIAATTWAEYKKYFEEDPALTRRFQLVKLDEPSTEDASVMLRGLRSKYEAAHNVRIRDDAVEAAVNLSSRYIAGRQLPDKAVDLLDTAAARVKISLSARPAVMEDLVRRIESLERELGALERDKSGGVNVDEERIASLQEAIESHRKELAETEARWKREKEAVDRVIAIRRELEEGPAPKSIGAGGDAAGTGTAEGAAGTHPVVSSEPGSAKERLDDALRDLEGIQGAAPLIRLEVDPHVVAQVVGDWTGIPVGTLVRDEAATLLDLEDRLNRRIKGQPHAVSRIVKVIRGAKAGLQDPEKPIGVFLLVGPSGVGKTETGLAVAEHLFGGERFTTTINMSEYQDREMGVSGLVGAKPGYVGYGKGGALTEAVRQRPYCAVLLDEIEKACVEVRNLFYQVFDKGELTDGTGRRIDFKNTIIFITSNLGTDEIQKLCSATPSPDPDEILAAVRPLLSRALQPAWLARTTVVPYFSLSGDVLKEITTLKMKRVGDRLHATHKMRLVYSDDVIEQITDRCTAGETGARNIDYVLQGSLLPRISGEILARMVEGELSQELKVGVDPKGEFTFEFSGPTPAARS